MLQHECYGKQCRYKGNNYNSSRKQSRDDGALMEGNQLKLNGVLVARAIVTLKDNVVPMRIANTSALPVTVFKGMKIGKAELIEEVNINAIETNSLNETPQWPNQNSDRLQLSLPEELTEVQRDKFVALLSQ